MATKSKSESTFIVSLEGLGLSKEQEKRIEKSINNLILGEISGMENGCDVAITRKLANIPDWKDKLGGGTMGIWVKEIKEFPVKTK